MAERTEELKRDIESTRDHMGTTLDAIGDRVSPGRVVERRWNRMRQSTSRVGQSIMGAPRQAAGQVKTSIGGATDSASEGAGSLGDTLSSAPDRVQSATQGSPLAAGAVAFGLGVLLGSLAPPSQEETRLAEQVLEPLQHEAQAAAKEVAGSVKDQAQEGVEQTKAAASEAAGQVKDQAQGAAKQVSDHASQAKDEVSDQAKSSADDVRSQNQP